MTILKWIGVVGAAVVAIVLLVLAYLVWSTDQRLEAQLAALRAAGEPLTWADLQAKPVPPEKNAAVFLARAASDLDGIWKELAPIIEKPGPSGRALTPLESDAKVSFEAYPKLMPLLKQAAACGEYDPQIDYAAIMSDVNMERVQKHRAVARVLNYRVSYLLSKNEHDEALRHSILLLRLTRHFEREPMLMSYLMTLACKGMGLEAAHNVLPL